MAFQSPDDYSVFETIKVLAIELITVSGRRIDLKEIFLGIHFYESIFEQFMSGKVFISDTTDMYKNTPLIGNEQVIITIQERATNIQRVYNFRLYKINRDFDVTRTTAKFKILECFFYSPEKQADLLSRISRKFWDFPDAIVEQIVRNFYGSQKEFFVDFADDLIEYWSNYHKGSSIIDFMCKNATSEFGETDFLFYESMAGFHFVPLSFLLSQPAVSNLVYLTKREMSFRIDDMQFFKQDAYFDINFDAENGLFGKTLYKLQDNDRYGIVKSAADYATNAGLFVTSGRNLLFDEGLFNETNVVKDYHHNHDVAQVRSAHLNTIMVNNKMVVRCQGTLDRKVGDILNVTYPNQDNIQEPNTSFDGSWVILAMKHVISNNDEYIQNIMLAKNARNVSDDLPEATGDIVL
jgi:hypothetical protein